MDNDISDNIFKVSYMNYSKLILISYFAITLSSAFGYLIMESESNFAKFLLIISVVIKSAAILLVFMTIFHGPRYAKMFFGVWVMGCCLIIFAGQFGRITG